ncbi:MAG: peptidoglycan-binding domain-containing protein [Patescibacteria group bacterium]
MKKILLISLLFVPVFASASIDANLKYGATGAEVIELQEFLVDKGFLVSNATGNFFSLTNSAVIKYQGSVGLPTTGFVGPMTREKINTELATKMDSANQQEALETGLVSTPSVNDKITQMLNQIKVLQELIAKQNQTQESTLTSIQQIQQNTTPAPVYVPPKPTAPAITFGTPVCEFQWNSSDNDLVVPFTVSGDDWQYGVIQKSIGGGNSFEKSTVSNVKLSLIPGVGEITLTSKFGNIQPTKYNNYQPPYTYTFTNTVAVPVSCSNKCDSYKIFPSPYQGAGSVQNQGFDYIYTAYGNNGSIPDCEKRAEAVYPTNGGNGYDGSIDKAGFMVGCTAATEKAKALKTCLAN